MVFRPAPSESSRRPTPPNPFPATAGQRGCNNPLARAVGQDSDSCRAAHQELGRQSLNRWPSTGFGLRFLGRHVDGRRNRSVRTGYLWPARAKPIACVRCTMVIRHHEPLAGKGLAGRITTATPNISTAQSVSTADRGAVPHSGRDGEPSPPVQFESPDQVAYQVTPAPVRCPRRGNWLTRSRAAAGRPGVRAALTDPHRYRIRCRHPWATR